VGPAAPPLEVGGRVGEIREGIYVREIGADDERGGAECRPLREAASGQRCADQGVTERVYSSLASVFTLSPIPSSRAFPRYRSA
jgi:hypothetical protein